MSSKVHRWSLSRLSGVAIVWLVLAPAAPVRAQAPDAAAQAVREELARLRQELEALRQQNAALEARMAALEAGKPAPAAAAQPAAPQPAPGAPPTEVAVPAGAAGAGGPSGSLPVYGNQNLFSKIFNPDIAVIGNFTGAAGHNPVEPSPSLAFDEAEATFQAVVDPYARADFFFGFSPEGVEIEEGYLTLTALPGGLLMKVG